MLGAHAGIGAELVNTGQTSGLVTGTPSINGPGLQSNLAANGINGFNAGQLSFILFNSTASRLLRRHLDLVAESPEMQRTGHGLFLDDVAVPKFRPAP